jgi:hypothetical protein
MRSNAERQRAYRERKERVSYTEDEHQFIINWHLNKLDWRQEATRVFWYKMTQRHGATSVYLQIAEYAGGLGVPSQSHRARLKKA